MIHKRTRRPELRLFDKRTYTMKFARRGSEAVNESEVSSTWA